MSTETAYLFASLIADDAQTCAADERESLGALALLALASVLLARYVLRK